MPYHLVVFQPLKKSLTVELRRLALTFFVNSRHLLESEQLRAEMDPNQDVSVFLLLLPPIYSARSRGSKDIFTP